MGYIILILGIVAATLLFWVIHLKLQIRVVSRQLEKRLEDGSRNSIYSALGDKDVVRLVSNLNKCFIDEENAKISLAREEKNFRNMIANISHDLRTPLTSIKGYLQLLSATRLDDQQTRRLSVIVKHTNELGDLIEHFFEYSCLLSDESQLNLERFNLTDEVTECLAAAVPQLESRRLEVRLTENTPLFVVSDREKSVRIIQNLVRNCLQHSAGNISVSVVKQGNYAVINVSNPVINPDKIDTKKIFQRFYTIEKSRSKSTGLGLSIVKLLTEKLGGSVSACLQENILTISVAINSDISSNT